MDIVFILIVYMKSITGHVVEVSRATHPSAESCQTSGHLLLLEHQTNHPEEFMSINCKRYDRSGS